MFDMLSTLKEENEESKETSKEYVLDVFKNMFERYKDKFKKDNLSDKELADKFDNNILPGFFDFALTCEHTFGSFVKTDISNYLSIKHGCWLNTIDFMNKYPSDNLQLAMGFIVHKDDLAKIEKDIKADFIPVFVDLIPHGFIVDKTGDVFDPTLGTNEDYHYFYQIVPEDVWKSFKYFYNTNKDWWVADFADWTKSQIRAAKESHEFYKYVGIEDESVDSENTEGEDSAQDLNSESIVKVEVRNEKGELIDFENTKITQENSERDDLGVETSNSEDNDVSNEEGSNINSLFDSVEESVLLESTSSFEDDKDLEKYLDNVIDETSKSEVIYTKNGVVMTPNREYDFKYSSGKTSDDGRIGAAETEDGSVANKKDYINGLINSFGKNIKDAFFNAIDNVQDNKELRNSVSTFTLKGVGSLSNEAKTFYPAGAGLKSSRSYSGIGFDDLIPFYLFYSFAWCDEDKNIVQDEKSASQAFVKLSLIQPNSVYQFRYQKPSESEFNKPISIKVKDDESDEGDGVEKSKFLDFVKLNKEAEDLRLVVIVLKDKTLESTFFDSLKCVPFCVSANDKYKLTAYFILVGAGYDIGALAEKVKAQAGDSNYIVSTPQSFQSIYSITDKDENNGLLHPNNVKSLNWDVENFTLKVCSNGFKPECKNIFNCNYILSKELLRNQKPVEVARNKSVICENPIYVSNVGFLYSLTGSDLNTINLEEKDKTFGDSNNWVKNQDLSLEKKLFLVNLNADFELNKFATSLCKEIYKGEIGELDRDITRKVDILSAEREKELRQRELQGHNINFFTKRGSGLCDVDREIKPFIETSITEWVHKNDFDRFDDKLWIKNALCNSEALNKPWSNLTEDDGVHGLLPRLFMHYHISLYIKIKTFLLKMERVEAAGEIILKAKDYVGILNKREVNSLNLTQNFNFVDNNTSKIIIENIGKIAKAESDAFPAQYLPYISSKRNEELNDISDSCVKTLIMNDPNIKEFKINDIELNDVSKEFNSDTTKNNSYCVQCITEQDRPIEVEVYKIDLYNKRLQQIDLTRQKFEYENRTLIDYDSFKVEGDSIKGINKLQYISFIGKNVIKLDSNGKVINAFVNGNLVDAPATEDDTASTGNIFTAFINTDEIGNAKDSYSKDINERSFIDIANVLVFGYLFGCYKDGVWLHENEQNKKELQIVKGLSPEVFGTTDYDSIVDTLNEFWRLPLSFLSVSAKKEDLIVLKAKLEDCKNLVEEFCDTYGKEENKYLVNDDNFNLQNVFNGYDEDKSRIENQKEKWRRICRYANCEILPLLLDSEYNELLEVARDYRNQVSNPNMPNKVQMLAKQILGSINRYNDPDKGAMLKKVMFTALDDLKALRGVGDVFNVLYDRTGALDKDESVKSIESIPFIVNDDLKGNYEKEALSLQTSQGIKTFGAFQETTDLGPLNRFVSQFDRLRHNSTYDFINKFLYQDWNSDEIYELKDKFAETFNIKLDIRDDYDKEKFLKALSDLKYLYFQKKNDQLRNMLDRVAKDKYSLQDLIEYYRVSTDSVKSSINAFVYDLEHSKNDELKPLVDSIRIVFNERKYKKDEQDKVSEAWENILSCEKFIGKEDASWLKLQFGNLIELASTYDEKKEEFGKFIENKVDDIMGIKDDNEKEKLKDKKNNIIKYYYNNTYGKTFKKDITLSTRYFIENYYKTVGKDVLEKPIDDKDIEKNNKEPEYPLKDIEVFFADDWVEALNIQEDDSEKIELITKFVSYCAEKEKALLISCKNLTLSSCESLLEKLKEVDIEKDMDDVLAFVRNLFINPVAAKKSVVHNVMSALVKYSSKNKGNTTYSNGILDKIDKRLNPEDNKEKVSLFIKKYDKLIKKYVKKENLEKFISRCLEFIGFKESINFAPYKYEKLVDEKIFVDKLIMLIADENKSMEDIFNTLYKEKKETIENLADSFISRYREFISRSYNKGTSKDNLQKFKERWIAFKKYVTEMGNGYEPKIPNDSVQTEYGVIGAFDKALIELLTNENTKITNAFNELYEEKQKVVAKAAQQDDKDNEDSEEVLDLMDGPF